MKSTFASFPKLILAVFAICAILSPAAFAATCAPANYGVVNVPFDTGAMPVSAGTAPFTYAVLGTLPAGLALNSSTGQVSGTPAATGTFSVQSSDYYGVAASPCPITITTLTSGVNLLGVANAYNLVALTGDISNAADITGRIAASGRVLQATTIGTDLRVSDPYFSLASQNGGPWAIVAGGGIPTSDTFNVNAGGNVYSSTTTNASFNFANEMYPNSPYVGSTLVTGGATPINFSSIQATLTTLGTQLAGLSANGLVCTVDGSGAMVAAGGCPSNPVFFSNTQHYNPSWLVLYGTNATLNVFNITPDQFQNLGGNLDIEVPTGSTVIINVAGTNLTLQTAVFFQGVQVSDAVAGTILFNFPNATSVTINGQFDGTLLAPSALLSGVSQMGGVFLAASIGSTGEVHYVPFTGLLPLPAPNSLVVTCATVNIGTTGVYFDSGTMSVTGGTGPYTYSIVGTLPAGLALDTTTGRITGTPSASGTFNVMVTDSTGASITSCAITINPALSTSCAAVTTGEVGVAFNSGPISVTGGSAPYTYTVLGTLPTGLTLNTSNGAVTGTPTASGTFSVKVGDAAGNSSTACPMTINPPLAVTSAATTTGTTGTAFNSGPMTVTGGTAPYVFSIVGTLPAGLTLNASTGAITGTPTTSGTFSVKVTDAAGASSNSSTLTIGAPLSVTCAATITGTIGAAFNSGPLTVTGGSAPYTYSIVGTLPAGLTLNSATGAVSGTPTTAGTFSVKASDSAGATSTSCNITINGPVSVTCAAVTTGEVGVAFNSGPMTVTGGSAPYTYSIVGTLPAGLTLNTATGAVTGTPTTSGTFSVKVTDANGAASTSCHITINGTLTVTCAATTAGTVGVPFNSGPLTVTGGSAPYVYSIAGTLPAGLTLNTATGAVTGTPTASGTFSIKVTDAAGASSTSCNITINAPLNVTCAGVTAGTVGTPFNSGPVTVTGGTGPYTYSIVGTLPAGLTLNTSTGAVAGTPNAAGTFSVKVTDAAGASSTSCNITINAPLNVTCAANTSGEVGVAFNSGPITVTGGTGPYTYSIVGTLPAGLTLNTSTGAVTGTATTSGSFVVKVTDAAGASSVSCTIRINPALAVSCAATTTGEVGVAFNSGGMAVSGGTTPYTYSIVGTLPAGLTLSSTNGAVTGTPTAAGTFTVKVTDALGAGSTACSITINSSVGLACASTTTGEVGLPFNATLTASGGIGPYAFSVATGALPAGISLNASTGAVTGIPATTGTFTVKVTDSMGAVASSTCPVTINSGITLTCASTTTGEVGVPFNATLTASGGVGIYTYAIATGTLPAGLTLNASTGAVTGTPSTSGTFTIKATDVLGAVVAATCPITINTALTASCAAVTTGQVGTLFNSGTMTVTGGTGPYLFSIAGTLPAGLTLNTATGAVSGTPTASGTFTVKVTDAAGASSSACSISISPAAAFSAYCPVVNSGQVGVALNSGTMTLTGGLAPYVYSIVGTLPAGLSLNVTTGAVTGTPRTGGSFSIQVKDASGATGVTCAITVPDGGPIVTGDTATIGYWQNNNGQALLNSLNGGPIATSLGSWLASNFPYLYGANSGTNLAGMTNAQVAARYDYVFGTDKTSAQIMAGAFAVYVTNATLAGGTIAGTYSFNMKGTGTGAQTYNVGTDGTGAGLTNSSSYTIMQLLAQANSQLQAGTYNSGTFNTIFSNINQNGDLSGLKLTVACPATTTGTVSVAFDSGTISVSGGSSYTYSIVGTLPAGLTLNTTTGRVTGTPTASGTFYIQVTGAGGSTGTTCPITINPGYTLIVNPTNVTVVAGHAATAVFTFAPVNGFVGTVNFHCSGLPAGATCSFSPSSLTANGSNATQTSTLTITTSAGGTATIAEARSTAGPTLAGIFLLPGLALGGLIAWRRRTLTVRLRGALLMLLGAILMTGGLVGCGSGILQSATPSGTQSVSIVATTYVTAGASSGSNATDAATFTLTVTK